MIQPVSYVKKLEGKSQSHLILFDDGHEYVVKYLLPGFEKSLANEWIAYCLARYLGLPVPYSLIVEIPDAFTLSIPEPVPTLSKWQFASRYVPGCLDGHQVTKVEAIVNAVDLPKIILFDYWLSNGDRTRKNILLREEREGEYRLWVIDHAEVFGSYNWTDEEIEELPTKIMKSATHELMAQFIADDESFQEPLQLVQTMPIFLLEELVQVLPDDWQVSAEERKSMVDALVHRRKKILPELIRKYIKKVF